METKNKFKKIEDFVEITTDKNTIKIFLDIAKNRVRKIDEICTDTDLEIADVATSLKKLEEGDFVVKNPNPLSNKYALGFNGQLFAEQLKAIYPEIREMLGDQILIEPIKPE